MLASQRLFAAHAQPLRLTRRRKRVPLRVRPKETLSPQILAPEFIAPCGMNCALCMYRGKYRMSMLENLQSIQDVGIEAFVASEQDRWTCPGCGGLQCVHAPECIYCGHVWALNPWP